MEQYTAQEAIESFHELVDDGFFAQYQTAAQFAETDPVSYRLAIYEFLECLEDDGLITSNEVGVAMDLTPL